MCAREGHGRVGSRMGRGGRSGDLSGKARVIFGCGGESKYLVVWGRERPPDPLFATPTPTPVMTGGASAFCIPHHTGMGRDGTGRPLPYNHVRNHRRPEPPPEATRQVVRNKARCEGTSHDGKVKVLFPLSSHATHSLSLDTRRDRGLRHTRASVHDEDFYSTGA